MFSHPSGSVARRLERNASTILISGLFLCCCVVCFLTLCKMPCEQESVRYLKDRAAFHEGHEPKKRDYGSVTVQPNVHKVIQEKFLIVLVLTGPKNFEERDAIRETWLQKASGDTKVFFSIGIAGLPIEEKTTLENENAIHKDLLLLTDLTDSYFALTDKVLRSFAWLENNVDFKFVFKVDDDTYSRIDVISNELKDGDLPKQKLYWGFFDGRARVKRRGQWAEKNWILCDRYTPHALGGGYILSRDLIKYIVDNEELLQKFNSEDISVGTWLGPLNINRIHDFRFDTEWETRGCNNKYIVTHKQSIADIKEKHTNLLNTGHLCEEEKQLKLSYKYNWKVDPTRCCIRNDSSIP